jgi:hypothetical protein
MARVFVINSSYHSYDKASKFGELVSITEGKVPIFKTDTVVDMVKKGLQDFSSDDYILVSGPAWLCMIVSVILFTKHYTVKFVVFDAKEQDYIVRHLTIETLSIKEGYNVSS